MLEYDKEYPEYGFAKHKGYPTKQHMEALHTYGAVSYTHLSMILLYGASASYHSFHVSNRVDMILKKIDHSSIFILIAGSYTPICLTAVSYTHLDVYKRQASHSNNKKVTIKFEQI